MWSTFAEVIVKLKVAHIFETRSICMKLQLIHVNGDMHAEGDTSETTKIMIGDITHAAPSSPMSGGYVRVTVTITVKWKTNNTPCHCNILRDYTAMSLILYRGRLH